MGAYSRVWEGHRTRERVRELGSVGFSSAGQRDGELRAGTSDNRRDDRTEASRAKHREARAPNANAAEYGHSFILADDRWYRSLARVRCEGRARSASDAGRWGTDDIAQNLHDEAGSSLGRGRWWTRRRDTPASVCSLGAVQPL